MTKLSLNQAAKHAGVAKKTLLERLHNQDLNKKLSGEKNERGHWQIDVSELDRVFGKPDKEPLQETVSPPLSKTTKTSPNSDLQIEVATLREQLRSADTEKSYLAQQIEDLKERAERAERKEDEARALLTAAAHTAPKSFWSRITGR